MSYETQTQELTSVVWPSSDEINRIVHYIYIYIYIYIYVCVCACECVDLKNFYEYKLIRCYVVFIICST